MLLFSTKHSSNIKEKFFLSQLWDGIKQTVWEIKGATGSFLVEAIQNFSHKCLKILQAATLILQHRS